MGYESRYEITLEDRRPSREEIARGLWSMNEDASFCLDNGSGKWFAWKEDIRAFSAKYPGVLFTVHRKGEDSGDIEVGYFLDGRYQGGKAELRVPKIDDEAWS